MGDRPTLAKDPEGRNQEHENRRYDVVVSYNRAEGAAVERIARRLQGEGLKVFFDVVHDRGEVVAGRNPRGDSRGGRVRGRHRARGSRGLGARGTRGGAVPGSEGPALPAVHGAAGGRAGSPGSSARLPWDPQLGGSCV